MSATSGPLPAAVLPIDGKAAPPRSNGELVFAAPWESRVFGITLALVEDGVFGWREFQAELIAEIAAWERRAEDGAVYCYYERWQAALESLLASRRICSGAEIGARAGELGARPHGHDHDRA